MAANEYSCPALSSKSDLVRDDSAVDLVLFDVEVVLDTLPPVLAFDVPFDSNVPVTSDVKVGVVFTVMLLTGDTLVVLVSFEMFLPKALFRIIITLASFVAVDWPTSALLVVRVSSSGTTVDSFAT